VFTEGLTKLRAKLDKRFYTTALTFARDLSSVFSAGIINDPPPNSAPKEPINIPSPKKQATDMKVRRSLAKRIIKAVQPQLEAAVRAEADITNKSAENLLKELEVLLDSSLQSRRDSISASMGEAVSLGDAEGDVEMVDAAQSKENGVEDTNEDDVAEQQIEANDKNGEENEDLELLDDDAPHELDDDDIVAVGVSEELEIADDTIIAVALAEVNRNTSPAKPHINGVNNTSTPPDTNGYVTAPETQQPAPPTPPISNGGHAADNADLNTGGVLWYLKDFQPEGTSIIDPHSSRLSEDLSDMDEEELKVLGGDINQLDGGVVGAVGSASPSKTKKGKAKKRAKPNRW
jgi:NuA3 HAT complex component NTO1